MKLIDMKNLQGMYHFRVTAFVQRFRPNAYHRRIHSQDDSQEEVEIN